MNKLYCAGTTATTATDGMLGGILADDRNLGKTLTIIILIFTNDRDSRPLAKPELGNICPSLTSGQFLKILHCAVDSVHL